jgi:hypothetical protein
MAGQAKRHTVAEARAIAEALRPVWPDKAAELDRAIEQALAKGGGTVAADGGIPIRIGINYRLEKFHGEYAPDKQPFEVIEGTD